MNRRDFLKMGASGAALGAAATGSPSVIAYCTEPHMGNAAPVLASYAAEDHRARLRSIALCERAIRKCMRKHLISSYVPGQACYNLCEYPCRTRWEPSDYDEQELDRLRDHGIQLIQVFDEWNDSLRLFGGHKLSALNPAGFRRFVEMAHQRGMKIIAYVSTGFLQRTDPDFRPEWSREGDFLEVGYWNMARCAPASAGWRAYLLPRILQVLDGYGLDGIYDDCGYVTNAHRSRVQPTPDEVLAFEESPDYDGALTDMLLLLYAEVKRRGGIVKLHVNAADQPPTREAKVYDYLWVGEGVSNVELLRERVKDFPPYVVPCIDMNFARIENQDEPFLHAIPYMQFPVLPAGRPFTGDRGMIPGVQYETNENDFWMKRCREARQQYQAHPDGPYTYSQWDALPADPESRPAHASWLKDYLPMVEEGTWAWLDIGDSDLFTEPLPRNVVTSAFANRRMHLVLANYGRETAAVALKDAYVSVRHVAEPARNRWEVDARSLDILRLEA